MSLRGPMICSCCGARENTSGCVRGLPCSCDWKHCRVCHKCKSHCTCEWKVTALFDGSLEVKTGYEGRDFEEVEKQVGHLAMIDVTDRIIVYKNGEQYRRLDLR